jgi:hypothetical protein
MLKEFVKKYSSIAALVFLLVIVFMFGYGIKLKQMVVSGYGMMSEDGPIITLLEGVIDAKLEPIQQDIDEMKGMLKTRNQYAVQLIFIEVKDFSSAEEVDERFDFLIENQWNAQIAALKCLSLDMAARDELCELLVDDNVEMAVLRRIQMLY